MKQFDMDAFGLALMSLSKAINEVTDITGIAREQLCAALHKQAISESNLRDAEMWKNAGTDLVLGDWIYQDKGRRFDSANAGEIRRLADSLSARVKRSLAAISKKIPASGGRRRKIEFWEAMEVKRLVKRLTTGKKRISQEKAYSMAAQRYKVSVHTIRRTCDKKERERTRQPAREKY